MHFDNLFLFFPKKFAFEEVKTFQDITNTFPIDTKEIDEFHYFSSKIHSNFEIGDNFFHQHWLLNPEKQFLMLTYLLERANCQQKSILVLQANEKSFHSYFFSTGNLIGKYNILPEYAIKYIGLISKEEISESEGLSSHLIEDMNLTSNHYEIIKFNVENNSDLILEIENLSQSRLFYIDRIYEGQVYCLLIEKI